MKSQFQFNKLNQLNECSYRKENRTMYIYKTEILTVGTKWFSDKADAKDIAILDNLLNERSTEGWELVTYDYMATSIQINGAFVITFRKEKE